ncbi:hypothetical protein [Corynebacterium wankanglinii]|uniref:DNA-binding protein n=1 Tax=Corynebacterium wankanglinii TaxID=2735136 RepID=A0A838CGL1_9CORY|nr:hypothetical protein [Corynebacterium wankanglinii]MBA1834134.1 hypothetical protein [Corynebacterium wankanglinii]
MSDHKNWYRRITGGDTERAASLRSDVTTSTLNRQLAKGELSAEVVIKLSRGYGISPVEGLAATGHITHEEATGLTASQAADLLSDPELIRALALRINADPAAWFGTFGELAEEDAEVIELGAFAADSSPDEPEEGDEGFGEGP